MLPCKEPEEGGEHVSVNSVKNDWFEETPTNQVFQLATTPLLDVSW